MESSIWRSVGVAAAVSAAACGGTSNGGPADASSPSQDASPGRDARHVDSSKGDAEPHNDAAQKDAAHHDAAHPDASSDAGEPDCGSVLPNGTQLVASDDPLILWGNGLTSDGYAFYEDSNTEVLYAVSTAGGTPASLGSVTSQSGTFYLNGGKAVLFLPQASSPTTSLAPLSAWSKASGPTVISTSAIAFDAYNYTYDATLDGAHVLYFPSNGDGTATLTVANIDGSSPVQLVANIDFTNSACTPMAQFVNDSVVAEYCSTGTTGDAAAGSLIIATFASPSYAQVIVTALPAPTMNNMLSYPVEISPDGTKILVTPGQSASDVVMYPLAGGAPTTISASAVQGTFTPNGDILSLTTDGALTLYTSTVDGGAPMADAGTTTDAGAKDGGNVGPLVTLLPASTGVIEITALSNDGKWLLTATNFDQTTGFTNVVLASATAPAAPTTEWSPTSAEGIGFTTDSTYELFATNLPTTFGIETFDLQASPVAGGTPIKIITGAGGLALTTGAKLIINSNPDKATGSSDIDSIDLTNPTPSTLVSQADPNFFYAATSNKVVYSWHCASKPVAGIWTVAAP